MKRYMFLVIMMFGMMVSSIAAAETENSASEETPGIVVFLRKWIDVGEKARRDYSTARSRIANEFNTDVSIFCDDVMSRQSKSNELLNLAEQQWKDRKYQDFIVTMNLASGKLVELKRMGISTRILVRRYNALIRLAAYSKGT